eukprot:1160971-Pelagomonas_calceolata.AAC.12
MDTHRVTPLRLTPLGPYLTFCPHLTVRPHASVVEQGPHRQVGAERRALEGGVMGTCHAVGITAVSNGDVYCQSAGPWREEKWVPVMPLK